MWDSSSQLRSTGRRSRLRSVRHRSRPIYTHKKIIKTPLLHQRLGSPCLFLSLSLRLMLWSMETRQAHSPARAFRPPREDALSLCERCKPCSRVLLVLCVNQGILASFSLSLSYRGLRTIRFQYIKGPQQPSSPPGFWEAKSHTQDVRVFSGDLNKPVR